MEFDVVIIIDLTLWCFIVLNSFWVNYNCKSDAFHVPLHWLAGPAMGNSLSYKVVFVFIFFFLIISGLRKESKLRFSKTCEILK